MGFIADAEQPSGFVPDAPAPAPKRKAFSFGGDANLGAGEAFGAVNDFLDRKAYQAGGAVTDQAAKILPAEAAAGLGYATNVGLQAAPALLGGEAAKLFAPAMRSAAERTMQSALKPGIDSLKDGSASKAIATMLDEGISVSKGGVEKLRSKISSLNDEIVQAIAASPATVDKNKAASTLFGTLQKFEKQVTPGSDIKAIEAAWDEFLNVAHPLIGKMSDIPVQLAQELKQGTYRILKGKYGEVGSASTEAQKALARGLKEGVADAVPGVAGLNAKESALLNALELNEHRAAVEGNKNLGGITWLAQNPGAFAAFMADRSSAFKSAVARMLNANQRTLPGAAASGAITDYELQGNKK